MMNTPREETNMSTPGLGARTMHDIDTDPHPIDRLYDEYRPIIAGVMAETVKASYHFPPMRSGHEGFAILKEEVDELWDEVRAKNDGSDQDRAARMRVEAIQVAAMALRFIHDVCGDA